MTNNNTILNLFDDWNKALQTGNPDEVVKLYDKNAILLPTLSPQVRHSHEEIKDYFVHFLAKKPIGKINESNVRIFGNLAINSGIYTFNFKDGSSAQARFTYVYKKVDKNNWIIVVHHSSLLP
ncbi:MAG: SgcJ/EcaC family oxidoreductase [Verrucomicrobiota bacterium]|nr:SgcJ/EcaC family oxidoreductase [Verrucomicrobiota bacterium]